MSQVSLQPKVNLLCQVLWVHVTKPYSHIGAGSTQNHQRGINPCSALYSDPLLVPDTLVLN